MSIRTKLILLVGVVTVFVNLLAGTIMYWQINRLLTEHANADIENTLDYTFQLVNFYLGRIEDNVNNLANDPLTIEALTTKDPQKLQQVSDKMTVIVDTVGTIETIALMEVNGSTCTNRTASKASLSVAGKDFSDRDYCKGIIRTRAPYLSSAYIGAVTKHPNVALVVPVKNPKGEMIGFVSGVINPAELRGYLWDLQKDSNVDLLDRYGTLFLNTKENITTLDNPLGAQESEVAEIQKRLARNEKEGYFREGNNFVGYRFNGSLTVVYETSGGNFLALTKTLNQTTAFVSALAMILLTASLYFFVGTITRRISRLSQITKDIANGQYAIKLDEEDLKAKDETAVLARAFNEMATKLSDIYKNLEEKVKQRTQELEEKTKKLEASEGEIKKALDASEQANKLMVGRELEMIKLKEKIKELEGRKPEQ